MSKQLSAEWEEKIYQEAQQRPKDRSHGYGFGWSDGYEAAAEKYVLELVEAQERIRELEAALKELLPGAPTKSRMERIITEALSPNNKQKEDE